MPESATTAAIESSTVDGHTAEWSVAGLVVYVHVVRWSDGQKTKFTSPVTLGEALSQMPRKLWQAVHDKARVGQRRRPIYTRTPTEFRDPPQRRQFEHSPG